VPSEDALALLDRRRAAIASLQSDLREDHELLDWLAAHPWLTDPAAQIEDILDAPELLSAIAELLGPVGNPRYVLVRRSSLAGLARADYHAVPAIIGGHKDHAEAFAKIWRQNIGGSDLVFTRNADGRQTLLRVRMRSFAAGLQRNVDRRSAWL